ncbi:MAG: hypothetical protein H6729_08060 [Deltaproteobacteria bacterium]|nr:hypothetical protein [Deltaproteobacteria bacterium]
MSHNDQHGDASIDATSEGTITEFDGADGLGWIELLDGRRIRFGLSGCRGVKPKPGTRVRVGDLQETAGKLRAKLVEPILEEWDVEERVWPEVIGESFIEQRWQAGEKVDVRVRRILFHRASAFSANPRWPTSSDFSRYAIPPAAPDLWKSASAPPSQPFFEPWHSGIVDAAVGCVHLVREGGGPPVATLGGQSARISGAWPKCSRGHGSMTLLLQIDPEAFSGLIQEPNRLTMHACVKCLNESHHCRLGEGDAAAWVEWRPDSDCSDETEDTPTKLSQFGLRLKQALSIPPSWLCLPRKDVGGHVPVLGVPSMLFGVKLLRDGATDPSRAYEDASFVFDRHYAEGINGIVLGGYPVLRFDPCEVCGKPKHQLLYLSDYFTDGEFSDLFDGSNELTLLACSRTPECGGPERGLLVLDP